MPTVVGVVFSHPGKTYYFAPGDLQLVAGDKVIAKTANGSDLGEVVYPPLEITEEELTAPLKPVLRKADEADLEKAEASVAKQPEALEACKKKVAEARLPMKLVSAEYSFDASRITYFFTSESRVDFRQLVKELSSDMKARIEMRQVGVRDAARQVGGFGPCGQQLCCNRFLTDFAPVSVRMAKDQDLPLNPAKISGTCGRLLCCLRYEHEVYTDFNKRAPKRGSTIQTPGGPAQVLELRATKEAVLVRLESGGITEVPLNEGKSSCGCGGKKDGGCCGQHHKGEGGHQDMPLESALAERPAAPQREGRTDQRDGRGDRRNGRQDQRSDRAPQATSVDGGRPADQSAQAQAGPANQGQARDGEGGAPRKRRRRPRRRNNKD